MQFGTEVDIELRPGGHGCHHRLEPQQPGHTKLAQGQAVFAGQLFAGAIGLIGVCGVPDVAQFAEDTAQG
ncbi:hypothetical protein D3C72_1787780 [compost metagenome]